MNSLSAKNAKTITGITGVIENSSIGDVYYLNHQH